METFTGLLRDFVVAVVGVLIIIGVDISDQLLAGILLILTTGLAMGTWAYKAWKASRPQPVQPVNPDSGVGR